MAIKTYCSLCDIEDGTWRCCSRKNCPSPGAFREFQEKPHIDFYATYRPRDHIDAVSRLVYTLAVIAILACLVLGWQFGHVLSAHGLL